MPDSNAVPAPVMRWHEFITDPDPVSLRNLLAAEVVFRSPAVHTPQVGQDKTFAYLWAASQVLRDTIAYSEQWYGDSSAVLRFNAVVGGLDVDGVDLLTWNDNGQIIEFTVMARPFKGLQALIDAMGRQLASDAAFE